MHIYIYIYYIKIFAACIHMKSWFTRVSPANLLLLLLAWLGILRAELILHINVAKQSGATVQLWIVHSAPRTL